MQHGKNGFAKVSKKLDVGLKIILLDYQNNYVGCSNRLRSILQY